VSILKQLEFKSWIDELEKPIVKNEQPIKRQYQTVLEKADFEALLERLSKAALFAFDTETTSLNYMDALIIGLSFSFKEGEAFYLPLAHDYENAPKQIERDDALRKLKPILESPSHKKVGQNLKYDKEILLNHGIELRGIEFDTMLEAYVLNNTETRYNLDSLADRYLKEKTISFEAVAGSGVKQKTFNQIPLEQAGPYAAEDADIAYRLHQCFWPRLQSIANAENVFREIEMPLIDVLVTMERHGVLVDANLLAQQSKELAERLHQLEQEVYDIAGETFNLASPKQLQEVLYNKLQLPHIKKTPSGQLSTNESVLQELALDYPLPKLILEYRSLNKLKSTYTDRLPEQINAHTGRVHTSYHQAITSTGRLSSTDPNLQNIPARTEEGRRIRQAFIAPPHYKLLAADYSQVELRIMAHLSQDLGLLKAFQNDQDIHAATASEIFNTPLEKVTSLQRREAKAINFGLIYGMSAFGLAKQIGVDRATAQSYIDMYFSRYPKVHEYMESIRAFAREHGYVETLHGRRLLTPDIRSNNVQHRNAAERAAINAPMQGTAAEIIKIAMNRIHAWLMASGIDVHMIMQVHDELVFEVHESVLKEAQEKIADYMNHAANLSAPLKVDIDIGKNWNL
ncbi:MAG: DNA polymerase I, partial [Gammaproteobacteria bacterium]|nr:DNA polymerase I [Gammaproteobacteria bacterium]